MSTHKNSSEKDNSAQNKDDSPARPGRKKTSRGRPGHQKDIEKDPRTGPLSSLDIAKKSQKKIRGSRVIKKPEENEFLLITGMSGAGRSTTVRALEDMGWYVVDNIPPQLIKTLADLTALNRTNPQKVAVVLDVRSNDIFSNIQDIFVTLKAEGVAFRVLFLDAEDNILIQRFEQAKRPHPLQGDEEGHDRISDGIAKERALLSPIKDQSNLVIDTSNRNVHELGSEIQELFSDGELPTLRISLVSFGFKYGLPLDSNYVADVRFVPNPHWIDELRPQSGLDDAVSEYVLSSDGTEEFIDHYAKALEAAITSYRNENKHYVTLAVGCTGGKHRSVAITEELAQRFKQLDGVKINVTHRDLGRE